jgi:hypothetical protein
MQRLWLLPKLHLQSKLLACRLLHEPHQRQRPTLTLEK